MKLQHQAGFKVCVPDMGWLWGKETKSKRNSDLFSNNFFFFVPVNSFLPGLSAGKEPHASRQSQPGQLGRPLPAAGQTHGQERAKGSAAAAPFAGTEPRTGLPEAEQEGEEEGEGGKPQKPNCSQTTPH